MHSSVIIFPLSVHVLTSRQCLHSYSSCLTLAGSGLSSRSSSYVSACLFARQSHNQRIHGLDWHPAPREGRACRPSHLLHHFWRWTVSLPASTWTFSIGTNLPRASCFHPIGATSLPLSSPAHFSSWSSLTVRPPWHFLCNPFSHAASLTCRRQSTSRACCTATGARCAGRTARARSRSRSSCASRSSASCASWASAARWSSSRTCPTLRGTSSSR